MFIELISLGVTTESLQAKRDRKSAISLQCGQFDPKVQVQVVAPTIILARKDSPKNALQLCRWQFSHKETFQHTFCKKIARRAFLSPLWGP